MRSSRAALQAALESQASRIIASAAPKPRCLPNNNENASRSPSPSQPSTDLSEGKVVTRGRSRSRSRSPSPPPSFAAQLRLKTPAERKSTPLYHQIRNSLNIITKVRAGHRLSDAVREHNRELRRRQARPVSKATELLRQSKEGRSWCETVTWLCPHLLTFEQRAALGQGRRERREKAG